MIGQFNQAPVALGEFYGSRPVLWVFVFVFPHAIMEISEIGNNQRISAGMLRQVKAVPFYCAPMMHPMKVASEKA